MTITSYQIQNVLRAYSRQLRRKLKKRYATGMESPEQIFPGIMRQQVIDWVAQDMMKKSLSPEYIITSAKRLWPD
ncbi:MAG: hypothetical protein JRI57_00470 [Deltaproteobacteria bacterium]|nr:hypothetical protein [Deltaproteobacteria bacterium]MBW1951940.1 hypothetical protein [Deltaproteobacteria bacterium]MBW1986313.1 hypothetical protein [Deltaproteobacteria bacterium]MBW2134354.1 hypothetical protein [Deltaproteobacteria bacterium]